MRLKEIILGFIISKGEKLANLDGSPSRESKDYNIINPRTNFGTNKNSPERELFYSGRVEDLKKACHIIRYNGKMITLKRALHLESQKNQGNFYLRYNSSQNSFN